MSDWKRGPYGTNERADSVYWQYDNGTAKRSVLIPLSVEQAIIRSHPQVVKYREALERIRDRSQRIVDGEIETGAVGAADYNVQVAATALAPWEGTGVVPVEGEAR